MVRKRPAASSHDEVQKLLKRPYNSQARPSPQPSSFFNPPKIIQVVSQYELLKSLVTNLTSKDLFNLAITCGSAYRAIFPHKTSRVNLTGLTNCDGSGIRIRGEHHQPYYSLCVSSNPVCASEVYAVETRPCVSCRVNTCNECRIHLVYQTGYRPRDAPDELPYWSGYALLQPTELDILSPEHLGEAGTWKEPANGVRHPHHDDGFLDLPLDGQITFYDGPKAVREFMDINLGVFELTEKRLDLSILKPFNELAEARVRYVCGSCFFKFQSTPKTPDVHRTTRLCSCTLKSRLLDRWLCLKCYVKEEKSVCETKIGAKELSDMRCSCGKEINEYSCYTMCLWCKGAVVEDDE